MRVYIPATYSMLVELRDNGAISARGGWAFGVTQELREFFEEGDEEQLEAIAFDDASEASIRLLAVGDQKEFPHRRVVISADVDGATPAPEQHESVVKVNPAQVSLDDVAAIHVDVQEAEGDTARAIAAIDAADLGDPDAEIAVGNAVDNYMAFYDPSELPFLVELL